MAYYGGGDANASAAAWGQAPARQPSWEQQPPPSRSGTSSVSQRDESVAFSSQFDEVDRAMDNLMKSGKMFGGMPGRRESHPMMGGGYMRPMNDFESRGRHSVNDFDAMRPHSSSNMQGFYANQRFPQRPSEAEQVMQAKRRMAAQRERDLRNYHQEQQFNRNTSGPKSDRSVSPNAMSEEERRELIARQHRALYGDGAQMYAGGAPGADNSGSSSRQGGRNGSPFDSFGLSSTAGSAAPSSDQKSQDALKEGVSLGPQSASPQTGAGGNNNSASPSNATGFGLFDPSSRPSTEPSSNPSPPLPGTKAGASSASVAPIGTRPTQQSNQASSTSSGKRSNTPGLPSPLSYGYSANEQNPSSSAAPGNERSASATSNPGTTSSSDKNSSLPGWGSNSGVWGNQKNSLGMQASVWG